MTQKMLFGITKKQESSDKLKTETRKDVSDVWIPEVGETVIVTTLNDGVDGIVKFVDHANLYHDYFFPIQLSIPSLQNMMYRTPLRCIKQKAKDAT